MGESCYCILQARNEEIEDIEDDEGIEETEDNEETPEYKASIQTNLQNHHFQNYFMVCIGMCIVFLVSYEQIH